jgi:hypothetical protein
MTATMAIANKVKAKLDELDAIFFEKKSQLLWGLLLFVRFV